MRNFDEEAKDIEGKKYSYDFDARIRGYAIRTFSPYFSGGRALELGCHKGDFTRRLFPFFKDITVVEGSRDMAAFTSVRVGGRAKVLQGDIETVELEGTYDAIFLINVLEHTEDPGLVLRRIKSWLSLNGWAFILVPNAYAPSRQVAVKMGLLEKETGVTEGEYTHGHRRTYTAGALGREALEAGLSIQNAGGLFFKALANYQFDLLMEKEEVITEEYMEACYQLSERHPQLCASLYLICGKGA